VSGGVTTVYVYDAMGEVAAEYSTTPATPTETQYLTGDHLGSTRLVTNAVGAVLGYHDYLPFGEEISAGIDGRSGLYGAADGMTHKFTAKEGDTETASSATQAFDYFGARYFSGTMGRFTSPDSPFVGQRTADPQSWNVYAYVRNNPLKLIDPDGRGQCEANAGGDTNAWLSCQGVSPAITSSDACLTQGAYMSTDSRYARFIGPNGRARLDRTGMDKTVGPELDAIAGGARLAGVGLLGTLRLALRAASERLGLEVSADVGIALSRAAIDEALASDARVLHAGRHLVDEGILAGSNAVIAAGTRTIASEVLSNPFASFITWIGAGAGEIPVRLFVGSVGGGSIGVGIADQAVGAVAKGAIVTIKVLSR
jgi:RHS repeat-associated protein